MKTEPKIYDADWEYEFMERIQETIAEFRERDRLEQAEDTHATQPLNAP